MENIILKNQISILDLEIDNTEETKQISEVAEDKAQIEYFIIEDIKTATWAMKKLRELHNKETEIKGLASNERMIIDNWEAKELKGIGQDKDYFEGLLKEYYEHQKAEDKKFKLSTPWGKVSSRKSKKWNWSNEAAIKEFLKENSLEDLIRVKEEINKTDFKKVFPKGIDEETGEIIQGLEITEIEETKISVEV